MIDKFFKIILLNILCILLFGTSAQAYPIAPTGQKFTEFLDSLDVTNKWLPYHNVEWRTGKTVSRYEGGALGTHCSTFVAAAASKLGVQVLPPEQGGLLANAQYAWLRNQGKKYGWAAVDNHLTAQQIANQGCLVVIAYANPNRHKPGHVAIVRPSEKPKAEIVARGPQIIQAGKHNYNSVSLSKGFRRYQSGLRTHKIVYYAHDTPFCKLIVNKNEINNRKRSAV